MRRSRLGLTGVMGCLAIALSGCGELLGEAVPFDEGFDVTGGQSEEGITQAAAADTYVRSGRASTNYGGAASVMVASGTSSSDTFIGYIRFAVPTFSGSATAKLRLYVTDGAGTGPDIVKISNTTWGENSTTWNNRPSTSGTLVKSLASVSSGWVEINVSNFIQSGQVLSLAIKPRTANRIAFNSRNASTNKPQLVVTVASAGSTGSPSLKFALTNIEEIFGKGPTYNGGWSESESPYSVVLARIPPSELPAKLDEAKQKDILIALNMAGSRNAWTDVRSDGCKIYDPAEYRAKIDEYVGVSGLKEAITQRRVIIYVVDEPHIDDFCGSITPAEANAMGLYVKSKWNDAITLYRMSAQTMSKGWQTDQGFKGPLTASDWTGADYGYGLYKGFMLDREGLTPAEWYPQEKQRFAALKLGMVIGINHLNHGQQGCWDYLNDGKSWGRIRGQNQSNGGAGVACGQGTGGEINWLASPDFLREIMEAAMDDRDAPFVTSWTHVPETGGPDYLDPAFFDLETRSDYVSAFKDMIDLGRQRSQWNGWRTAKPPL
jgi:hypothetical protein